MVILDNSLNVLNLEYLTKKYQTLLIEYQQAVVNYTNYLKDLSDISNNTVNDDIMVTIKGVQYWGTGGISQNNSKTINECKASCIAANGCSGAIYNAIDYAQPMCWLRSGESNIIAGKENDYSIIKKDQYLLSIIENLNEQLIDINQKIMEIISDNQPVLDSNVEDNQDQNSTLIDNYKQLTQDREKIAQLTNEYQTLEEQQIQGDIKINQNYYSFLLLIILAIIIIFMLYSFSGSSSNIQRGGNLSKNAYYFVFGIIILVFYIIYSYTR
jgi:superfamily II RNA helicase